MVCSSQVLAQETGIGDQFPAEAEQQRFPFENYDFYRVEEADDGTAELVSVERQSLGLYTPEEHFQQAASLGSAARSVLAGDYWTAWGADKRCRHVVIRILGNPWRAGLRHRDGEKNRRHIR